MSDKIYVDVMEYSRLCRLDGRMDALISSIQRNEREKLEKGYGPLDIEDVKTIIGMYDE